MYSNPFAMQWKNALRVIRVTITKYVTAKWVLTPHFCFLFYFLSILYLFMLNFTQEMIIVYGKSDLLVILKAIFFASTLHH